MRLVVTGEPFTESKVMKLMKKENIQKNIANRK